MNLQTIKTKTTPILENEGIVKAAVFGSYATEEAKQNSDVDLLIKFTGRKSLFDLVGLKLELENVLKKKVDLLTYRSIHPLLQDTILSEQKIIYEKKS
ncbi:nucleotidyltransferase family protein [Patescibacteria group bacterium]|nr:nucleotidyltransferase family protein [Patescibacteria group bacterium]MBU1199902.1 nucleotidyltransferase family protein [Patescibacteria group bacterium]MBU1256436.1 nucleotidyltransferase family protein [Patescibacteria group bacterium]MBU1457327.1 nucleotidyltransferase family protein [Patescibacteria group bacterium]